MISKIMITEVSGSAHDAGESGSHADQRVGARAAGVIGEQGVRRAPYRASQHGADEQAWAEDAARVAGGVARGRRDHFQQHQQRH